MSGKITIPTSWREALEGLIETKGRALILGENDTGKTTLITYLAKELLRARISVSIVDADVGQSDIGPPTTVGLGEPSVHFSSLKEIPPTALYFVGSTSPVGHLLPLLVGVRQMVDIARGKVVLINTTGLVRGPGLPLKTHKIEITKPDILLALQRKGELEEILSAFPSMEIRRLDVSSSAVVKSVTQRRAERERTLKEYFQGSQVVVLSRRKISVQRSYEAKLSRGQLIGLADGDNCLLALGVVKQIGADVIDVKTPVKKFLSDGAARDIKAIQLSETYFDKTKI